ncbi:MAG: translation initiation factor [Tannerellaceae bacterium]|jgi:translation initiation factor 1|nr:translation initiation factor [Tannerellaceae bacterium]
MKKNEWKERRGVMYSTDPDFRYETEETPETDTLPKDKQPLRIAVDKRRRAGKTVTLVTGFRGKADDLESLGKMLKAKCGVGGTAKEGEIILQGDCRSQALEILHRDGYVQSRLI